MKTVRTIAELRADKADGTVGLVPTMGAYHDGHLALFRAARAENDVVIASLFVNPAQFGANEDLASYPRDEERDARLAEEAGIDVLFAPGAEELYPTGFQTWVEVEELSTFLEGEHRPGHFRGVATICLKLFNIVKPDRAYFGQKDAQQVAVLKRMVRDLNLEVEIRVVPTVRDADGLALSSRNSYLSPAERERALLLPRALATKDLAQARARLNGLDVDYVEVADFEPRVLAAAVRVGKTRLIDNVILEVPCQASAWLGRDQKSPVPGFSLARARPKQGEGMSTRPRKPGPATPAPGKLALPELLEMKRRGEKIVMVTAYDAPGARLADAAGIDLILVGDTAAMVVLGHDSTVPVTMDEMIFLTRSVARAAKRPLIIGDMPFGTYEASDDDAVHNAVRFVKEGGADVVKLEGAGPSVSRVRAISGAGIGVMGHIGLTPQSATVLGGFKAQGRTADQARQLFENALALEAAGCFAVVLEAVPAAVAERITEALTVPTIGIGAGAATDGQVLVYHDLLGLYEGRAPRFVKRYANLADEIRGALERYAADVREQRFPEEQHTYSIPDEELAEFEAELAAEQAER